MRKFLPLLVITLLLISCVNNYEEGIKLYESEQYSEAIPYFEKIPRSDENFHNAQMKILDIDSILSIKSAEELRLDSIAKKEEEIKELEKFKEQLTREISSAKQYKPSPATWENVTSLQLEIILYNLWIDMIRKSENSTDEEVQKLGSQLQNQLVQIQKVNLPKLRKSYGEFLKKTLWEHDIEVKTYGTGNSTLEFTAGMFAANKNKQEFQTTINENLHLFRFKRTNYKWYKYDDSYTYYTIETPGDGELQKFN